ncbi:MAG: dinitrogenase iron-molybdenum cofactor biosynthesis protein [Gammaproteobacteria bacterium]|nr:dinitrogenase iron-molybdenum cofactor biosynthesis protein [Gammaproteobacteria bacterium]
MNATTIGNEIALRIGLAARALPDTDAARLLRVLGDAVGLPPSAARLAGLSVKDLKSAGDGEFADLDNAAIKAALACLKGEFGAAAEPLPGTVEYRDEDMPNSIRVACASNNGAMLDGHFGSCSRFLIFQVSATEQRLIEIRCVDDARTGDDKNSYRASLIADCQIVFVASIGGPAAAKVVRTGAHLIKRPGGGPAKDEVSTLQQVIAKGAPPWLAKVMGESPYQRIRFKQPAEEGVIG